MARARAAVIEHRAAGGEGVLRATADAVSGAVKTTVNATARAIYGTCYYTSFGASYVTLAVFRLLLIGDNPIGHGIQDGAVAAGKVLNGTKKRARR